MEFILNRLKAQDRYPAEEENYVNAPRAGRDGSADSRRWEGRSRSSSPRSVQEVETQPPAEKRSSEGQGKEVRSQGPGKGGKGKGTNNRGRPATAPTVQPISSEPNPKNGWRKDQCSICWALKTKGDINHLVDRCPKRGNHEVCGFCVRQDRPHQHDYRECPHCDKKGKNAQPQASQEPKEKEKASATPPSPPLGANEGVGVLRERTPRQPASH